MAEDVKDKWIRLVNLEGTEEDVWDYPGHVDRLLTIGWTRPIPVKPGVMKSTTIITTDKEN